MALINVILAAVASAFTFAVSFLIVYAIVHLLGFLYALLNIRNKFRWLSDGVLTGSICVFLTCYVSVLITKHQNFSELKIIVIALLLPLLGEIGYYRHLAFGIKTIFWGRLHLVVKNPIERGEFAANLHDLQERFLLDHSLEEFQKEETTYLLRKEAYDRAQGALAYMFLWSLVGYIIGLILVHHFLF